MDRESRTPIGTTPAYHTATVDELFRAEAPQCSVCGQLVTATADSESRGFDVTGRGVYMSARQDEIRFEEAPLCASCATAIGLYALARWEIGDEEG